MEMHVWTSEGPVVYKCEEIDSYLAKVDKNAKEYINALSIQIDDMILKAGLSDTSEQPYAFSVQSLPRMAQLTFGTRSVHRIASSLKYADSYNKTALICDRIVNSIDELASVANWYDSKYRRAYAQMKSLLNELASTRVELPHAVSWIDTIPLVIKPFVFATALVAQAAIDDNSDNYITHYAAWKISLATRISWSCIPSGRGGMVDDFHAFNELAKRDSWTDDTPVPESTFSTLTSFATEWQHEHGTVLDISRDVNTRLLKHFQSNPEELQKMDSRLFEKIIADLFVALGFDTQLLAQTRDGGRDIIAIDSKVAHLKYLIECKRRSPHVKVGIAPVQRLHGVVQGEGATKGVLVTTSYFTQPAKHFINKHEWQLEGCDFDRLKKWLTMLDNLKLDQAKYGSHSL